MSLETENLVAMGRQLIVREIPVPEQSAGGVHLAPSARDDRNRGVVLSVGPKVREEIPVGAIVLFSQYGGQEFAKVNDDNDAAIVFIDDSSIIAIEGEAPSE